MLKLVGLLCIAAAFACAAVDSYFSSLRRRELLSGILGVLGAMRREICVRFLPLPETLEKLSKEKNLSLREFFSRCARDIRLREDVPFGEIWRSNAEKTMGEKLHREELETFCSLGSFLGCCSAAEQEREIEKAEKCFESFRESERVQGAVRGRLRAAVSLCIGAAAVILMM